MSTSRPRVVCHMITSLDGKILGSRWGKLPGGKTSSAWYETTAASFGIGAWLVGTTTMRELAPKRMTLPRTKGRIDRSDHVVAGKTKRFAIGTDAKAVLRLTEGSYEGDHIVLLLTERAGNDYLAHLRAAGVSYLFCGDKQVDLHVAMTKLHDALGIKKLMVQGGGTINGAMLAAGLIDEVSHLVVPVIDGGAGIPTLFDVPGPTAKHAAARLRLRSQEVLDGGVTWTRYRVVR